MLVALQIRGKWDGRKYVFDAPAVVKLYTGPLARALGGGGGGTTQEFTPTGPWSQQVPYISGLFGEASRLYNQGGPQYYPGSTVAGTNPNLAQTQQNVYNTTGQSPAQNVLNTAAQNQQSGTMAGQVGAGQIMPYNQAVNQLLQNATQNPTQGVAQSALPAFYGGLQQAQVGAAPVSMPQNQFGNVNAQPALYSSLYSNGMNPYLGDIVNAALRSQNNQYAQNVLPQISSAANMAGQLGGTRQGIAEGIAAQNQAQMQKDLIAQLYGQAFDVGSQERLAALGLVGQGQQVNTQASLGAQQLAEQQRQATMQSGLGQSQLVGQMLGQGQQLGNAAAGMAGQIAGNMIQGGSAQNIQNAVQNAALVPGLTQAINANLGIANQTGLQQQAMDQAQRDADVERWFYQQYAPMNMLSQYQQWVTGPYGASADPYGGASRAGNYTPMFNSPAIGTGSQLYSGMPLQNPTQQYMTNLMQNWPTFTPWGL